ncbi:hypothetical protein [uncultured Shimia sp.]|uniref:hypothetical protein n=1 Tax=uncultured Shimia sp. TaxID=573152 RepID=UPI002633610E|nr:hypothetical protein [uncultured Shimia sp.]
MRRDRKKPLYRKVNTRTHGVRHGCGRLKESADPDTKKGMRKGLRHGLDYTPLYKYLLSKVGKPWAEVYSEATSRLDSEEPIWDIVARSELDQQALVRGGESSYYNGLYVDDDGYLVKVDPALNAANLRPFCSCCTHTFNGEPFGLPFLDAWDENPD